MGEGHRGPKLHPPWLLGSRAGELSQRGSSQGPDVIANATPPQPTWVRLRACSAGPLPGAKGSASLAATVGTQKEACTSCLHFDEFGPVCTLMISLQQ